MTITLITGANKGLGRETARRLLEIGHTILIGARDAERGPCAREPALIEQWQIPLVRSGHWDYSEDMNVSFIYAAARAIGSPVAAA
jgi:NAD(P)-dependent dehydrogenase (short-subunit alcohol dehydrogenase family)